MKDQLTEIARLAREKKLPFLFVGGHAVIGHGVPRFTRDIDIMTTDEWRGSWRDLIVGLGYRRFHSIDAFDQFEPDPTASTDSRRVGIDLMMVDSSTWEKLYPSAVDIEINDGEVGKVPSVLHLISMKLNASRNPHRRAGATDLSDVIELIHVAGIDISSMEFLEIGKRYASAEDLEAIQKSISQSEKE